MRSRRSDALLTISVAAACLLVGIPSVAQNSAGAPEGAFRIAGTVVSKTDGHLLTNARVILASVKARQNPQSVITSDDGKFEFTGVPAGKYSLTGAKRGFTSSSYDQHYIYSTAIVTGAGLDTEHLVLKLAPQAIISGKVLDETGEPVRDANVGLYRDSQFNGTHQIIPLRGGQTNDLGEFEIPDLAPGTYFLSARAHPWYAVHPQSGAGRTPSDFDRSLDVAYPITYYNNAIEPDSATPISVQGGEHLNIDFHLNPVPSLHVMIHVPDGVNGQFPFPQFEQSVIDGSAPVMGLENRMVKPGTWEISGIPAGKYDVRLMGQSTTRISGVELDGTTQELDTSTAEPMCNLSVTISFEDGNPPGQYGIELRAKSPHLTRGRNFDSKGQAKFENIAPGRYEIALIGEGTRFTASRMQADGASLEGHSITLTAGSSATLSISAVKGSAEIQGVAKQAGKPFAGAMMVLVPRNPDGNRDLFRRDQSDLDGTFTFPNVIPGSYTAVAIEDGWDLDWSRPELISAYAKRGVAIEVASKPDQHLSLNRAVEVQSK